MKATEPKLSPTPKTTLQEVPGAQCAGGGAREVFVTGDVEDVVADPVWLAGGWKDVVGVGAGGGVVCGWSVAFLEAEVGCADSEDSKISIDVVSAEVDEAELLCASVIVLKLKGSLLMLLSAIVAKSKGSLLLLLSVTMYIRVDDVFIIM